MNTAGKPAPSGDDPRPVVRLARPALSGPLIGLAGILAAGLLFLSLDGRRGTSSTSAQTGSANANAFSDPPPLTVPPDPKASPAVVPVDLPRPLVELALPPASPLMPIGSNNSFPEATAPSAPVILPVTPPTQPIPAAPPRGTQSDAQNGAPALVIDVGPEDDGGTHAPDGDGTARPREANGTAQTGTGDAQVRATYLRSRTDVMPIGTLIPAVLETPIDTARPGLVRAVISRDVRGFDGRHVLVPRGSRVTGEYQSEIRGGQNRVLISWTRLLRPDGATIRLGSPAADALGGAGVPGHVNSFFLERFAGAFLQSALNVGVNLAARPGRGSVIVGLPSAGIGSVGQTLLPTNDLRPKITVKSGAIVNVFVARDLDFTGTGSKP